MAVSGDGSVGARTRTTRSSRGIWSGTALVAMATTRTGEPSRTRHSRVSGPELNGTAPPRALQPQAVPKTPRHQHHNFDLAPSCLAPPHCIKRSSSTRGRGLGYDLDTRRDRDQSSIRKALPPRKRPERLAESSHPTTKPKPGNKNPLTKNITTIGPPHPNNHPQPNLRITLPHRPPPHNREPRKPLATQPTSPSTILPLKSHRTNPDDLPRVLRRLPLPNHNPPYERSTMPPQTSPNRQRPPALPARLLRPQRGFGRAEVVRGAEGEGLRGAGRGSAAGFEVGCAVSLVFVGFPPVVGWVLGRFWFGEAWVLLM